MASSSGDRKHWPTVLAGCIGTAAGMALSWLALESAWPGLIATIVGIALGLVTGQFVGSLMFRRPPGTTAS